MDKAQVAQLRRLILVQFEGAEADEDWGLLLEDCGVETFSELLPDLSAFERELAPIPVSDAYAAISKAMYLMLKAVADKAGLGDPLAQKIASSYVGAVQPDLILQLKNDGYL